MFSLFRKEVEKLVGPKHAKFLEVPREPIADLALPCFALAKEYRKDPKDIAINLAVELSNKIKKGSLVKSVRASGPYINFYINESLFSSLVLKEILSKGEDYGSSTVGKGKTIVIDYSSPNIAKPMSVGHLRSTVIGQALCNIHKFLGYRVIGDNHIADWGTHLGNLIYAYRTWGNKKKIAKNPIPELLNLYVKFYEEVEKNKEVEEGGKLWFKKLESGNQEAKKIWKLLVKWSEAEFEKTYKKLKIRFDYQIGESFYVNDAKKIIKEALRKKIAKHEEGAVIIPMNGTPLVIQKSDESTLYSTRDLACIKYRKKKFRACKILYVVGSEQKLYFKQVFYAAKQLGYLKEGKAIHVDFGLVSLPGGKMSTRLGRVVFLEDFIKEAVHRAAKTIEEKNPNLKNKKEIAELVALAAIKYSDLSKDRIHNTIFDWSSLSFEGDTGPYLQYTAVRANSILNKTKKKTSAKNLDKLTQKEETDIIKQLSLFPLTVESSLHEYKPHLVANYLYELATKFNEYYHKTRIIGSDLEEARLSLVFAVFAVLKTGLCLLGIEVPSKM